MTSFSTLTTRERNAFRGFVAGFTGVALVAALAFGCASDAAHKPADGKKGTDSSCPGEPLSPAPLRRLTRFEYQNAVSDVFGTELPMDDLFPRDEVALGFDNQAGTLGTTDLHVEGYLEAATLAGRIARRRAGAARRNFRVRRREPGVPGSAHRCARAAPVAATARTSRARPVSRDCRRRDESRRVQRRRRAHRCSAAPESGISLSARTRVDRLGRRLEPAVCVAVRARLAAVVPLLGLGAGPLPARRRGVEHPRHARRRGTRSAPARRRRACEARTFALLFAVAQALGLRARREGSRAFHALGRCAARRTRARNDSISRGDSVGRRRALRNADDRALHLRQRRSLGLLRAPHRQSGPDRAHEEGLRRGCASAVAS